MSIIDMDVRAAHETLNRMIDAVGMADDDDGVELAREVEKVVDLDDAAFRLFIVMAVNTLIASNIKGAS